MCIWEKVFKAFSKIGWTSQRCPSVALEPFLHVALITGLIKYPYAHNTFAHTSADTPRVLTAVFHLGFLFIYLKNHATYHPPWSLTCVYSSIPSALWPSPWLPKQHPRFFSTSEHYGIFLIISAEFPVLPSVAPLLRLPGDGGPAEEWFSRLSLVLVRQVSTITLVPTNFLSPASSVLELKLWNCCESVSYRWRTMAPTDTMFLIGTCSSPHMWHHL